MTNSIKKGDFLKTLGSIQEVIYVKTVTGRQRVSGLKGYGELIGVVTTSPHLRLHVKTVYSDDIDKLVIRKDDVDLSDHSVTTVQDIEESMGSAKFGTLADMAEAMWENNLGGCTSVYTKSRSVRDFLEDNRNKPFSVPTHTIVGVYAPFASDIKSGNISLTRNLKDLRSNRQTSMKPGRAFRYMFPDLGDKDIAMLAESWLELTSPRTFTLHVGKGTKDFARSFGFERADYRNPNTTHNRKAIATSCMQHVDRYYYDGNKEVKAEAAEAYASGDFLVVWVEDEAQRIAGRVVVGLTASGRYHAPLYGACEQSLDMLQTYLDSINSEHSMESWSGLCLKVVGDGTDPIVPYIDGDYSGEYKGDGFIELMNPHEGELSFDNTDGHISYGGLCCECCHETYPDDDLYSTDEGLHCEGCFDQNYVHLACGDVCLLEDAVIVKHKIVLFSGCHQIECIWVYEDEAVYCEDLEENWHGDDVTYSEVGAVFIPSHLTGDYPDLFPSEEEDTQEEEKAA